MPLDKFLYGLEGCSRYVTSSPHSGLSHGTKIITLESLERNRHAYFKKRHPHWPFVSYFSIFKKVQILSFVAFLNKVPFLSFVAFLKENKYLFWSDCGRVNFSHFFKKGVDEMQKSHFFFFHQKQNEDVGPTNQNLHFCFLGTFCHTDKMREEFASFSRTIYYFCDELLPSPNDFGQSNFLWKWSSWESLLYECGPKVGVSFFIGCSIV